MSNSNFSPFYDNATDSEPKSKRLRIGASRILQSNITGPVLSSATACLLNAAQSQVRILVIARATLTPDSSFYGDREIIFQGSNSLNTQRSVLEEFGESIRSIITHTIQSNRLQTKMEK